MHKILHFFETYCTSIVVVWHTGKVLACSAVGPWFNSRQGQGILLGLFCSVSGWHTTPVARWVG